VSDLHTVELFSRARTLMGVLTTIVAVVGATGVALYVAGRRGVVGFARLAGKTMGTSVARARRTRGQLQKTLVDAQTPEQQQTAMRLQRNMWRARMIANEFTMVRNLSPRLLHRGNYGFTEEELVDSIASAGSRAVASVREGVASRSKAQMEAHADRQLEMEGQAISNPAMFPFAGRHGKTADTRVVPSAGAVEESIQKLEPELHRFHWTMVGDDVDPATGHLVTPSVREGHKHVPPKPERA
jgi:hypothetical protein